MAKVVAASHVSRTLPQAGWRQAGSPAGSLLFVKGERQCAVALHPLRPEWVYLADLQQRLPDLPAEIAAAATDETLDQVAGFELLIDPGEATDALVDTYLATLAGVNVSLGGRGLDFDELAISSPILDGRTPAGPRRLRIRPRTDGASEAGASAWRHTVALLAERALPSVDQARRAVLQKLLDSFHARSGEAGAADLPDARHALERAEAAILDRAGVLRYPSAPFLRELDPGPRRREAVDREAAFRALRDAGALPSIPAGVRRIVRAANAVLFEDADRARLVQAVERDPAVAARAVHRATRADVPIPVQAKQRMNVTLATRLLGAQRIRSLALTSDLVARYGRGPCDAFDYRQFWQECTARGAAARVMARTTGRTTFTPDDAFTAGLLCQIGRLAFATALPQEYAQAIRDADGRLPVLREIEFHRFRLDHHELAAEMMSDWQMPDLTAAVLHQADPGVLTRRRERDLARVLRWTHTAWEILRRGGDGIERALLEAAAGQAVDLGVPGWSVGALFDELRRAWAAEADLLELPTRPGKPWEQLLQEAA